MTSFSKLPGETYAVRDGNRSIGRVGKVYRGRSAFVWCPLPVGEHFDGTFRAGYRTRSEAARGLARYVNTGERRWVA
jgi:hypothetical protein